MSSVIKYHPFRLSIHGNISYYTLLALVPAVDVHQIMQKITYLENYCFPADSLDSFALKQFNDLAKIREVLQSEKRRKLYNSVHQYANYSINKRLTV